MVIVKVFINKHKRKSYALVLKTAIGCHFLSFDAGVICSFLDIAPSELDSLEIGEYDQKGEEVNNGSNN